jgi:hypothetical protein
MKLDKIVFYRLKSCRWISECTEHAHIVATDGRDTVASLFYPKKLHGKHYGNYSPGLGYTHELYIVNTGAFYRFSNNAVSDVIDALAKVGYIREDG